MSDEPAVTDAEWEALDAINERLDASRIRREKIIKQLGLKGDDMTWLRKAWKWLREKPWRLIFLPAAGVLVALARWAWGRRTTSRPPPASAMTPEEGEVMRGEIRLTGETERTGFRVTATELRERVRRARKKNAKST